MMDITRMFQIKENLIELSERKTELMVTLESVEKELRETNKNMEILNREAHAIVNNYLYNKSKLGE